MTKKFLSLPKLNFSLKDLEPVISQKQLEIHYLKHHQAYITGANEILENWDKARNKNSKLNLKDLCKSFAYQYNGYFLHKLFWENLQKPNNKIDQKLGVIEKIKKEFKNFERFKTEFSQAALSVEGSGWAALFYDKETDRLIIGQIEKHNLNLYVNMPIILVLDMFEHAYYLDYENDKSKYIENFWQIVNWQEVDKRHKKAL